MEVLAGQRPNIGNGQAPGTVTGRGVAGAEAGAGAEDSAVAVAGFAAGFPDSGSFVVTTSAGLRAVFFGGAIGRAGDTADTVAEGVPAAAFTGVACGGLFAGVRVDPGFAGALRGVPPFGIVGVTATRFPAGFFPAAPGTAGARARVDAAAPAIALPAEDGDVARRVAPVAAGARTGVVARAVRDPGTTSPAARVVFAPARFGVVARRETVFFTNAAFPTGEDLAVSVPPAPRAGFATAPFRAGHFDAAFLATGFAPVLFAVAFATTFFAAAFATTFFAAVFATPFFAAALAITFFAAVFAIALFAAVFATTFFAAVFAATPALEVAGRGAVRLAADALDCCAAVPDARARPGKAAVLDDRPGPAVVPEAPDRLAPELLFAALRAIIDAPFGSTSVPLRAPLNPRTARRRSGTRSHGSRRSCAPS